jgi:hypothetical protein
MDIFIWNIALTAVLAFIGYVMKEKSDEVQRIGILLNKTREEVARDHITRVEVQSNSRMLLDRLDRLEQKIDRLVEQHRA